MHIRVIAELLNDFREDLTANLTLAFSEVRKKAGDTQKGG
jgi:hypothetical protein